MVARDQQHYGQRNQQHSHPQCRRRRQSLLRVDRPAINPCGWVLGVALRLNMNSFPIHSRQPRGELANHTSAALTGTKMPRANWNDISRYEVALPPKQLAADFTEKTCPFVERIIANTHQSPHTRRAARPAAAEAAVRRVAPAHALPGCQRKMTPIISADKLGKTE